MLPTRLADKSENSFRRSRRFSSNQVQLIFRFLSVPFADGRRHGTRREPHFHRRPSTQEATKKEVEEHFAQFDTLPDVHIDRGIAFVTFASAESINVILTSRFGLRAAAQHLETKQSI